LPSVTRHQLFKTYAKTGAGRHNNTLNIHLTGIATHHYTTKQYPKKPMNPILPRVQTAMHHALRHRLAVAILLPSLLAIAPLTAQAGATTPQNAPRPAMPDNGKRLLRGTVTDENGEPLMGVSVSADGSTPLTVTDADGKFSVPMPANATQLTFTYVGMATQTINIGQRSNFHIAMSAGEQALKDVIVTGYQTISRERTTGSFNVVTPEKLKGKLQTSILARLEGMVPGMMQQNGTLYIRGMSTLNGGANAYSPLFVVDGFCGTHKDTRMKIRFIMEVAL